MRGQLGLTQHEFAALLGFTPATANRWERKNKSALPCEATAAILVLLESVLKLHRCEVVLAVLRDVGAQLLPIMRALVWLEQHPPPILWAAGPLPFSPHVLAQAASARGEGGGPSGRP